MAGRKGRQIVFLQMDNLFFKEHGDPQTMLIDCMSVIFRGNADQNVDILWPRKFTCVHIA